MKTSRGSLGIAMLAMTIGDHPLFAQEAGNAVAGTEVFKKCVVCHKVGPGAKNGLGPTLNGIIGRPSAMVPAYNFSEPMKNAKLTWDATTLGRYLKTPQEFVPGTKMTFVGLSSDKDIADVIAYLADYDADGNKTPR